MDQIEKRLNMSVATDLSYQKELLPVDAIQIHKNSQGTADLQVIVTASNNKDYAVKTISDGNGFIPASELFCYELARLLDIPTPNYDLVTMRDGTLAFGSVWEGGVHHIDDQNRLIAILTGVTPVRDLKLFLSRVYAYDLFINNLDRHLNNYLFRESYKSLIGLAFDYSRAWYEVGAYGYESMDDKKCKTQLCHQLINECGNYEREAAVKLLDRILNIEHTAIERILKMIPDDWLEDNVKKEIITWWGSQNMADRISKLKGGV